MSTFAKHATHRLLAAAVGLVLSAAVTQSAWGQCPLEWVQRFDVPAARVRPAMAYDSLREVVVMLGGDNNVPNDDDVFRHLWEWDGVRWSRRTDITGGPQGQLNFVDMVYDSWRGVMVLRVRRTQSSPHETWEFDGQSWSLRSTGGPQQDTIHLAMAFDSWRGVTVLWGAEGVGTWEWKGGAWTFREAGPIPGGGQFALAFDENRGVTVAFGIDDNSQAQTWEWDGESWELASTANPPRRVDHALAYDPRRRRVLMYGGQLGNLNYDDTWAWDGEAWMLVSAGQPNKRDEHGMAYDVARDRMVVFGGGRRTYGSSATPGRSTEIRGRWRMRGSRRRGRVMAWPMTDSAGGSCSSVELHQPRPLAATPTHGSTMGSAGNRFP